jgi:hypothetical protein
MTETAEEFIARRFKLPRKGRMIDIEKSMPMVGGFSDHQVYIEFEIIDEVVTWTNPPEEEKILALQKLKVKDKEVFRLASYRRDYAGKWRWVFVNKQYYVPDQIKLLMERAKANFKELDD